ncbi:MAG: MlaE family lipid ABC transporter permease subunit [Desulfovibrio sp.]
MKNTAGASYSVHSRSSGLCSISILGRLDSDTTGLIWKDVIKEVGTLPCSVLRVDVSGVSYADGAGISLFLYLKQQQEARKRQFELVGLAPQFMRMYEMVAHKELRLAEDDEKSTSFTASVGKATWSVYASMVQQISFVGEVLVAALGVFKNPRKLRIQDVVRNARQVGYEGLPIILLIGFLMGLIMSFQSAVTLMRFGAEVFVANMLGIAMFREMGPLVTAILLAGRSGSAFAAEIGTMKVNEELDALTTMGLSPVTFLVLPKLLATLIMVPLLTIFFNFASLVGGAIVMLSMGYPLTTFTSRVFEAVHMADFTIGMAKAVVFAILVAAVGCLRGVTTKSGAGAVGESTTSAVVSGIVLIAVADGLFAVASYYLGI